VHGETGQGGGLGFAQKFFVRELQMPMIIRTGVGQALLSEVVRGVRRAFEGDGE